MNETPSLYEVIGGAEPLRRLVDRFYDLMEDLPEVKTLREMHPESTAGSRDKLFDFLSGWTGGPSLYTEKYGHPRLRARHLPFRIGKEDRDQWLLCFYTALDEMKLPALADQIMRSSIGRLADHMRNVQEN